MKTQLIAIALFTATVATITLYPTLHPVAGANVVDPVVPIDNHEEQVSDAVTAAAEHPRIEVVFALDTTSSMTGFIEAAKEKIWSIATTMASAQPAPEIQIGLVAFRDRGDDYVTRVTDLSGDLDSVYAKLMDFRAVGGGDGPESVNQALYDSVHGISWSPREDTYKVIFLVGDAPPHMDYQNDVKYPETIEAAKVKGIKVNTIQSGQDPNTARAWQRIAGLSDGDFFNVAASGDAVSVATPFDTEIATLSRALDDTRMYFGSREEKVRQERKLAASAKVHEEASIASRARRAAFNSSESGASNFLGENELVDAVTAGRVDLDALDDAALPASLQALPAEARETVVKEQAEKRSALKKKIADLTGKRDRYIADKLEADGGAEASLDDKLYDTVRRQAAAKGLIYGSAPKY